jgi:hypothetical protein
MISSAGSCLAGDQAQDSRLVDDICNMHDPSALAIHPALKLWIPCTALTPFVDMRCHGVTCTLSCARPLSMSASTHESLRPDNSTFDEQAVLRLIVVGLIIVLLV